jgi:outer membrane protein TolC
VLSAEIRFADDRAALLASRSEYELSLDRLKDEIGLPIEMPVALDSTSLSYTPITLDESALVRQALENNPLMQNAEIAISRSRLQHRIAKNALLPQLDLVASYSSNLDRNLISNLDESRTGGWTASLSLRYPFLSREESAKAEVAEIAVSQQEDRLLEVQRQITIDVRDIVRGVYSAAAQLDAITASIKIAQEKFDFSTYMFNLGRASNFDITESQEFLLKAQNQYLRKLVEYHTQLALLESLIGKPITP